MTRRIRTIVSAVAVATLLATGVAFAVHELGLFELDGDAVDAVGTLGDDWNQIYCDDIDPTRTAACGPGGSGVLQNTAPSNAVVSTFATDPFNDNVNDDIFTGGGSKDSQNISDWLWKFGSPGDKGDIEHAYASLYNNSNGDAIIYFGMDRLANNGDAALGFWFTQEEVSQQAAQTPAKPFSGVHRDGDVLVQTDWPQATGASPRIQAYVWDNSCFHNNGDPACVAPSQGGLRRTITGATCASAGSGDNLCATANAGGEAAPWPYHYKDQGGVVLSPTFPEETLFEGGLNLSAMFPGGIPCISTFVAETRVSNSETATLDDKLVSSFDLCSIAVKKEGPDLSKKGDTAQYKITVTNDGALPLTKISITDSIIDLSANQGTCGATLAAGESCEITVPYVITSTATELTNTVTASYKRDTATIDTTVTETDSHTVTLIKPTITFDKKAEGSNGPLTVLQGATVDYTLKLTNTTSSEGAPDLVCTITDSLLEIDPLDTDEDGDASTIDVTLANGTDTTVAASKTFALDGTFTNTASVSCTPVGFTNVIEATDSVRVRVLPSTAALTVAKTGDGYSKAGDAVNYTITVTNISGQSLTLTDVLDNVLGDLLDVTTPNPYRTGGTCVDNLALADQASCTVTATRTTLAGDSDPKVNIVTATLSDGLGGTASAQDDHSVDLVHPSFTVAKDCSTTDPIPAGQMATFRIRIHNTGDITLVTDISDPMLSIDFADVNIAPGPATCGDADWNVTPGCYETQGNVLATGTSVENTVNVHATLPASFGLPNQYNDSDDGRCTVTTTGATRTWGFWKTHGSDDDPFGYTCHVFTEHLGSSVNLGSAALVNCQDVFGIFWADPAKNSNGTKRSDASKKVLHASQQFLAAILNTGLTNAAPPPAGLFDATRAALLACTDNDATTACNTNLLTSLASQLAAYNGGPGDNVAIIDGDGATIPHADPRGTRLTADKTIADFVIK